MNILPQTVKKVAAKAVVNYVGLVLLVTLATAKVIALVYVATHDLTNKPVDEEEDL